MEEEADLYGMYFAALAGFRPAACESLFEPGGPLAGTKQGKSAWLSDHPEAKDRLSALRRFKDNSAPGGLKHLLAAPDGGLEVDTPAGLRLRSMAPADEEERERVHAGHLKASAPPCLAALVDGVLRLRSGLTAASRCRGSQAIVYCHIFLACTAAVVARCTLCHSWEAMHAGDTPEEHPNAPKEIDKEHFKGTVASLRLPGLPGSLRQVVVAAERGATALEAGWIAARVLVIALLTTPMLLDGMGELRRTAPSAAWKARAAAQWSQRGASFCLSRLRRARFLLPDVMGGARRSRFATSTGWASTPTYSSLSAGASSAPWHRTVLQRILRLSATPFQATTRRR